jgi:hypothetical protein
MASFKIFENVLNEYVNHPTLVLVEEVEAETAEEAVRIFRTRYPNKGTITVNNKQYEE